jgi:hypothetical protein
MLAQETRLPTRFALDPADAMIFITNTPLFVVPFIPGQ